MVGRIYYGIVCSLALLALECHSPKIGLAQGQGGQGGQGGQQGQQGQGGGGVQAAGVEIDAAGVLRVKLISDRSGKLEKERRAAGKAALPAGLARASERRYVSLNRLEAVFADRLAKKQPITDEMKYLAGLTRIRNVFYFPDSKDIVIAGQAEGFAPDVTGRVTGIVTGRPVLQLEDLIVALRAYSPAGNRTNVISVSIDPTQQGLANMQRFLVDIMGKVTPGDASNIAIGLRENLGLQVVSIRGISPQSHFAQVLVEADYRMKLIGIGLEVPSVKIESYVARANPKDVSRNAMERWYFVPNYECVRASEDGTAMEMIGDGVKLIGENERVTAEGGRLKNANVNKASQSFVQQFTAKYPELARVTPVYAQLRNLIDMTIAAAYIQQHDFYGQAGWKMETFGNEATTPVEIHAVPKQVESAVNVVWKGTTLITPIGGGVQIRPLEALSPGNLQADSKGELKELKKQVKVEGLANGQWWWD